MTFAARILLFLGLAVLPAAAQDAAEVEKSRFTRFVEDQLSAENRRISLNNIEGALSSDARIGEITIADREGVWLRIEGAEIVWTRTALLLGRLEIDRLAARRIEVLRTPLPAEGAPAAESGGFALPELPVSIRLDELDIPEIGFAEAVFGLASRLSLNGAVTLSGGTLDARLDMTRLDGPGGRLQLALGYANETRILTLDLDLEEPRDGIVANLLSMEGRPAVDLAVKGEGPLDDLAVDLTLDADGSRILSGRTLLTRAADGLAVDADLEGPLSTVISPAFRQFFGDRTALRADALVKDGGGVRVERLDLRSGSLSLSGSAETASDNFLSALALQARIAAADGSPVTLPVPGGMTRLSRAALDLSFGREAAGGWSARLDIDGLDTPTIDLRTVAAELSGEATGLNDPAARRITATLSGRVAGIETADPDVKAALGETITLSGAADWRAGEPISLQGFKLAANALSLAVDGSIADSTFDGRVGIEATSIAPFAGLADRPLAGALSLAATGRIMPLSGGFDLDLDGRASGLKLGSEPLDRLLASDVALEGGLARTEEGLKADFFSIRNEALDLALNGTYAPAGADLALKVALADLAILTEKASGALAFDATVKGVSPSIGLALAARIGEGRLAGKRLSDAVIGFAGELVGVDPVEGRPYGNGVSGDLSGSGYLEGEAISLAGSLLASPDEKRLNGLSFAAGGTRVTGDLSSGADGLIEGELAVDAPNIATAAAIAAIEATGAITARLRLAPEGGGQNASVDATLSALRYQDQAIGSTRLQADIADFFGVPKVAGSLDASDARLGGVAIRSLSATADRQGDGTRFSARSSLENGTDLSLAGALTEIERGFRVLLETLELASGSTRARLTAPAEVKVEGEDVTIGETRLDVAGGTVTARGTISDTLDLDIALEALPLSIANTIRPDLQAAGELGGTARVTGPRENPQIAFDLTAAGASAKPLADAGLPPVDLSAKGRSNGAAVDLDAALTAAGGIRVTAAGSVPTGDGAADLRVEIERFPLATLDRLAGNQGLSGDLKGSARITGALASPEVSFSASASGLSARPLAEFGLAPLALDANGTYAASRVSLSSATLAGPSGLSVRASGTVPLDGGALAVSVQGALPLSLAGRALAERGTRVEGSADFSLNIGGPISAPVIGGMVSTSNAAVFDPDTNLRLTPVTVLISIANNRVMVNRLSASLASGGTVTAGGSVLLDPAAGLPADLTIGLDAARYLDGDFIAVTASGRLTVTGPLLRDPVIAGTIDVDRAEIGIPDSLGAASAVTDVTHVNTPADVARTLARAKLQAGGAPVPTARPSLVRVDVTVNAPRRIFVRGRGLDAELGGSVRVTGPVSAVEPVGAFRLIRGRLSILGKRIVLDEGTATLTGSLDPFVNLSASSQSGDTTVTIGIRGRASDPEILLSSQPALPQDEVIARLIFDKGISELSGFQIARLAAGVAELAGGGGASLLGQLRAATGLDDLDVVTDSDGNTAVRAGRYIRDNVYLGVQAGQGGSSEVTIDLDITENLKARGAAGAGGNSSIGLFFEKDY